MARPQKPTMRDVARLAGVSTTTVSAAINDTAAVSPARRERVLKAMAALDYHPDAIARGLRTGRTHAIGVIIPDITNAFYPEIIRGIEDAAQNAGYAVLFSNSNENAENELSHLGALSSRRVDGALIACCANSTAYATLIRHHLPAVFVDRIPPAATHGSVSSDNLGAGHAATRHLLDLGHDRIAFVAGHLGLSPHHERLEGFRKAMQEVHLPVRDEYLICGDVRIEEGFRSCRRLLDLEPPPTAIMVANDRLLLGVLQGLDERKISVPKEISVLCFDDPVWTRYSNPSMTAIAHPTYEIGKSAFELLEKIIGREKGGEVQHLRLPTELRVRGSTGPPRRPSSSG